MNAIASKLTALRIPTRGDKKKNVYKKQGKGSWAGATVRAVLKNQIYTGLWHYGKTRVDNRNGRNNGKPPVNKQKLGKQVPRSHDEWIEGEALPIIGKEVFKLAQERIHLNIENSQGNTIYKYLLRGRLQ